MKRMEKVLNAWSRHTKDENGLGEFVGDIK